MPRETKFKEEDTDIDYSEVNPELFSMFEDLLLSTLRGFAMPYQIARKNERKKTINNFLNEHKHTTQIFIKVD